MAKKSAESMKTKEIETRVFFSMTKVKEGWTVTFIRLPSSEVEKYLDHMPGSPAVSAPDFFDSALNKIEWRIGTMAGGYEDTVKPQRFECCAECGSPVGKSE